MKKLVAVLLTGVLMIGSSMSVLAGDVGEVKITSSSAETEVHVEGNVTGDVWTKGEVETGVTESGERVVEVKVDGDVGGGIIAVDNSKVEVGGNAGNVMAAGASKVKVDGNVSGGVQINDGPSQVKGESKVIVGGDVEKGVSFDFATHGAQNQEDSGVVVVEGTVKAWTPGVTVQFGSKETADKSTLVAYKTEGEVVRFDNEPGSIVGPMVDASEKVFYIIKKEAEDIGLSGTIKKEGYDTAHAGDTVMITVAAGYEAASTAGTIEKNADGTYKITIPAGGGVTISAIEAVIEEMENNDQTEATIPIPAANNKTEDDDPSSEDSSSSDPAPAAETQMSTVGAVSKLDAASLGEEQYTVRVVNLIAQAPADATVSLEVTDAAYLNDMIISALKVRSDVSIRLVVKFMGADYGIVIPAGYDLTRLIGADGKIDFAALFNAFGAKAL